MSWSYTPGASPSDQCRQLITDTDAANPIFADEEILAQLNMESALQPGIETGTIDVTTVYFAAASLLETIGTSEVLVQKVMKALDVATDGAKQAVALLARAKVLRGQAEKADGGFDWAEQVENVWTERERIISQSLRNAI